MEVAAARGALNELARMRAKELKGFVDGLFGNEDELGRPQKAHEAVVALSELPALFDGTAALLADGTKPAPDKELKALLRNLQQLTIAADENINKAIQSCKRARGQDMATVDSVVVRHPLVGEADDRGDDFEDDDEHDLVDSPLSQMVTHNGVTVRIATDGADDGRWILEVVDAEHASHVWDKHFQTDEQALAEALEALNEAPLECFGRAGGAAAELMHGAHGRAQLCSFHLNRGRRLRRWAVLRSASRPMVCTSVLQSRGFSRRGAWASGALP